MKQIVVPLSTEAMKKLDYDQADDNELYVFKLSEQEVNLLFEKNYFYELNEVIDTYVFPCIAQREKSEYYIQLYFTETKLAVHICAIFLLQTKNIYNY